MNEGWIQFTVADQFQGPGIVCAPPCHSVTPYWDIEYMTFCSWDFSILFIRWYLSFPLAACLLKQLKNWILLHQCEEVPLFICQVLNLLDCCYFIVILNWFTKQNYVTKIFMLSQIKYCDRKYYSYCPLLIKSHKPSVSWIKNENTWTCTGFCLCFFNEILTLAATSLPPPPKTLYRICISSSNLHLY